MNGKNGAWGGWRIGGGAGDPLEGHFGGGFSVGIYNGKMGFVVPNKIALWHVFHLTV